MTTNNPEPKARRQTSAGLDPAFVRTRHISYHPTRERGTMRYQLFFLLAQATVNVMAWIPANPYQHRFGLDFKVSPEQTKNKIISSLSQPHFFGTNLIRSSTTQLKETNMDESEFQPFQINWVHALTWFALSTFAFSPAAPGNVGSDQDIVMLQAIIANPLHPEGVNSLFYVVFNLFGPMPLVMASLLAPQQSPGKIPAGPFLIASSGIGYFSLGIYLALRSNPSSLQKSGWLARNVAENKLISWALVLFCSFVYAPFLGAFSIDGSGFVDLLLSSRFAAISTLDLGILYVAATKAVADDYRLRIEDNSTAAIAIAVGTALVPYFGASLYCALRPTLPEQP